MTNKSICVCVCVSWRVWCLSSVYLAGSTYQQTSHTLTIASVLRAYITEEITLSTGTLGLYLKTEPVANRRADVHSVVRYISPLSTEWTSVLLHFSGSVLFPFDQAPQSAPSLTGARALVWLQRFHKINQKSHYWSWGELTVPNDWRLRMAIDIIVLIFHWHFWLHQDKPCRVQMSFTVQMCRDGPHPTDEWWAGPSLLQYS